MDRHIVALLTDFGHCDSYVAIMKGVILGLNREAKLVDISHEIALGDVKAAAYVLSTCVEWFPEGAVFLVVVDPGVGSNRKALKFLPKNLAIHFTVVIFLLRPQLICRRGLALILWDTK